MNYPGLEHLRADVAALSNAMKDVSAFRFYPPPPSGPRRDNETPLKLRAVTACAVTSL